MKNQRWILTWLIAGTLAAILPASAAEKPPARRSVLESVEELDKPVTYTETKIPLSDLVAKVAADTGVTLAAAKEVADEPVAVVVKEMPARELLEQVAELLDYRWGRQRGVQAFRRSGVRADGTTLALRNAAASPSERPNARTPERLNAVYEIYQDLAAKQREEALRQSVLGDTEKRMREELRRYAEMAALSPAQIQGILETEQRHHEELDRLPAEEKQRRLQTPAEQDRQRRRSAAMTLMSPVSRALALLIGRLPARQWELLRAETHLFFSTDPEPGELPLPAGMAETFRSARPTLYRPAEHVVLGNSERDENLRKQEKNGQELWAAATGYRVSVWLDDRAFRSNGGLFLSTNALPLRGGVSDHADRFEFSGLITTRLFLNAVAHEAQLPEDAPPDRAALAADPVLGARKRFQPEVKPRPKLSGPGTVQPRLRDLLPDLARTYGAQFVMDAYDSAPGIRTSQIAGGEPLALHAILDRLALPAHRWDRQGNLVRLRSRTWFFDRPREVPLRLVQRWTKLYQEHDALPLEAYLEMVTLLSDDQLNGLGNRGVEGELPYEVTRPYGTRSALRLLAALTPGQRQALVEGRPLPVARMTAAQRAQFLAAIKNPNLYQSKPRDVSQWTAGNVSLSNRNQARVQLEGMTLMVDVDANGKPDPRRWAAMREGFGGALAAEPGKGMGRPFTSLRMRFQYGPELKEEYTINVAAR